MNTKNYIPRIIDTTKAYLPDELKPLVESLAENYHDMWALERQSQGWTYGKQRNDELKTHPCLVPYEDLPESEKEYDLLMAENSLRFIIALGYRIVKEEKQND
jgi:ryanodine receptor 2